LLYPMTTEERKGKKKIQTWIDAGMWDKLEAMGFKSQTAAVTKAFENLIGDPSQIPDGSFCIPELCAQIEGLQLLLQEKDERIADLKKENDRLDFYAQYFKSIEHRRLEASTEEIKPLCP
ncbi:MAG: hypothetical protein QG610_903, partial [Euryarchaeota archaeon]|nr:hypothetical protein [Euryarchaeota archaeon]